MSLKGKTLFITGASRGIGLAIALRAEEPPSRGRIVNGVAGQHDLVAAWTQHPDYSL
jgi:short-subunit dehydrogenase